MEFFNDLYLRFHQSFIVEDRWSFFLDGFWMTLLLTIASFILGTLLGALLCALKLSGNRIVCKVVNFINSLFIQLPTLVLLMMFVYIIFGSSALSVVVIIIFGLTIKAGCYMADIFYSAVTTVSKGEIEAATTLGLNKWQIFTKIILPQAASMAMPIYQNQFIITLQETSIVGYLAIMDLTRVSDIITARTLDAMFGLVSISIIYLMIGWTGKFLLGLLNRKRHIGDVVND